MTIKSENRLKAAAAGFTLIEAMIAMAIAGILTSISVPNYVKYKEKARIEVAVMDMRFIEKELAAFEIENGRLATVWMRLEWIM